MVKDIHALSMDMTAQQGNTLIPYQSPRAAAQCPADIHLVNQHGQRQAILIHQKATHTNIRMDGMHVALPLSDGTARWTPKGMTRNHSAPYQSNGALICV